MILEYISKDGSKTVHDTHERRYLPEPLRTRAVEYLRTQLSEEVLTEIRELHSEDPDDWAIPYHFGTGMGIRNLLRDVIKDDELPPVMYGDLAAQNWDDYYVEVMEEAAGV